MARDRNKGGFTLVELMMVVAIIGILAAVAIPAFSRYVRKSRTAEAVGILNRMWNGSITYYETDHQSAAQLTLPRQFPGPSAVEAVPAHCGCLPGAKCPGGNTSWNTDPIWQGLSIVMADAHSYLAAYSGANTGTSSLFTAAAFGDLDCDGIIATWARLGRIDSGTGDVAGGVQPFIQSELE